MKRIAVIVALLISLSLVFMACGRNGNINSERTESVENETEIIINNKLLNVSGNTSDEMMEMFVEEGHIEDAKKNDDGTVSIFVTEEERIYWKERLDNALKRINKEMQEVSSDYLLKYDEDHSSIQLYYNQKLDASKATAWILGAEMYCALYQVFDTGDSDWYVSIAIYNSDTNALVASGDSNSAFSYDNDDWENSYKNME